MRRAENDNFDLRLDDGAGFKPSWMALFLPSIVIGTGYAAVLAVLIYAGRADGALARLCIAVLALGMPLLLTHAVLRFFTVSLELMQDSLIVHPGFPRRDPYEVPYQIIREIRVRHGIAGRLTGSGTLIFELVTGQRIRVRDLQGPERIRSRIERVLDRGIEPGEAGTLSGQPDPGAAVIR